MEYDAIELATSYTYGQSFDEVIEKLEICLKFVNGFTIMIKPIQENVY